MAKKKKPLYSRYIFVRSFCYGGFEIKSKPLFSFFKSKNTESVLKSPFYKDMAVSRRYRHVLFLIPV